MRILYKSFLYHFDRYNPTTSLPLVNMASSPVSKDTIKYFLAMIPTYGLPLRLRTACDTESSDWPTSFGTIIARLVTHMAIGNNIYISTYT